MPARILAPSPANLKRVAARLRRGGIAAIPTETVYGLAANALNAAACRKIFAAKRRPADDPLIVHVAGLRDAEHLAVFNPAGRALARNFWPGPLTLVLPRKKIIPDVVTSGQSTVALRSPSHPVARRLLALARIPLAAPSANLFGYVSPTTAEHVRDGLGDRISEILDGGRSQVGVESTIVDLSDPAGFRILRPGAVSARQIAQCLRQAGVSPRELRRKPRTVVLSPGQLGQHYSPATPLVLRTSLSRRESEIGVALIRRKKPAGRARGGVFHFSRTGSAAEVARNLYAVLRAVDGGGFRRIEVESLPARPSDPLVAAINDRLARAAGRRRNTSRQ